MLKVAGVQFSIIVRCLGVLLVVCLLLMYNPASVYSQDNIDTTANTKDEIDAIIAKIDKATAEVNTDLHDTTNLKGTLVEQQQYVQSEIDKTESIIVDSKLLINKIQAQIDTKQKEYDELLGQMKSIVFEVEKESKVPIFLRLISSENLADALSKTYSYTLLQSKAETLRQELETTKAQLQTSKDKQVARQAELENTSFLLKSKKSGLDDLINTYRSKEQEYANLVRNLAEQKKAQEAQIYAIQNEEKPNTSKAATGGCWFEEGTPLNIEKGYLGKPANGAVSRVFDRCRHDAADIANSMGTELWAVADGVVYKKGYDGGGYGNYIYIKHTLPSGQRVYALYGHMRSQSRLGVGDLVGKGGVVGYMGSTGFSTGPHVHFALFSESFEQTGNNGCRNGGKTHSFCYDPTKYINF